MFKFKRTKNFLLNENEKYKRIELIINWILVLSIISSLIFMICFGASLQKLSIINPKQLAYINLPEPTNTFAIGAFLSVLGFLISLIIKIFLSFKRGWKNAKNNKTE